MRHLRLLLTIILLPLLLWIVSCSQKKTQPTETANRNETSWPVSSPEAQGMDSKLLTEMLSLHHLLTMSTGLDARDSYLYRWSGLIRMRNSNDWVGYILNLPMAAEPGSKFDYSNLASHLLSAIITQTTGLYAGRDLIDQMFERAEAEVCGSMSELDFYRLLAPIVAELRCGHSFLSVS